MYMYYILGYLQATKKAYKLEDIFLLALDGDVDFQPNAVLLVLDRMKRNPDVGAACGRIHPTGMKINLIYFTSKRQFGIIRTVHLLSCRS